MRRSIVSLFSFLAIALIALTGCQEPQNAFSDDTQITLFKGVWESDSIYRSALRPDGADTVSASGPISVSIDDDQIVFIDPFGASLPHSYKRISDEQIEIIDAYDPSNTAILRLPAEETIKTAALDALSFFHWLEEPVTLTKTSSRPLEDMPRTYDPSNLFDGASLEWDTDDIYLPSSEEGDVDYTIFASLSFSDGSTADDLIVIYPIETSGDVIEILEQNGPEIRFRVLGDGWCEIGARYYLSSHLFGKPYEESTSMVSFDDLVCESTFRIVVGENGEDLEARPYLMDTGGKKYHPEDPIIFSRDSSNTVFTVGATWGADVNADDFIWISSSDSVIRIEADENQNRIEIHPYGTGTAEIVAYNRTGQKSWRWTVVVDDSFRPQATSIRFNERNITIPIEVDNVAMLHVTVSDGYNNPVTTGGVVFESSNPEIVRITSSVDRQVTIQALKVGSALISATYTTEEGVELKTFVNVKVE